MNVNIGGGYNNSTGIFTCPLSGTYAFSWSIAVGSDDDIVTVLVVNSTNTDFMDINETPYFIFYKSSRATAVTRLNEGDTTNISIRSKRGDTVINAFYTMFSGWMV